MDSYNSSSMSKSPELAEWCSRVNILKHIQMDKFAESFSDGVLFFYLVQQLLPQMAEELATLDSQIIKIVADSNHFGKLDNWKLINGVVLDKLMIKRSDWFLGYVARGKDGYIQDLLEDFKKNCPNPARDEDQYQPTFSRWNSTSENYVGDGGDVIDERQASYEDEYNRKPSHSFYHTPLDDENLADNQVQRRRGGWRTPRFRRFSNNGGGSYRWGSQQQQEPLRQIQRDGNRSFINKRQTNFRYFQQNSRPGNRNFYARNQWSGRGNNRPMGEYQRYLIPRDPRDWNRNQRSYQHYQRQRNDYQFRQPEQQQFGHSQQMNEQDCLNRRFDQLQNDSHFGPRGNSRRNSRAGKFRKYFYRYYLQFVPVRCNNCIDNNLECNCPRFGGQ